MAETIYAEDFVEEMKRVVADGLQPSQGALAECAQFIRGGVLKNFQESSEGDGTPWAPRKSGGSHPLLILSGAMSSAATGTGAGHIERIDTDQVEVGLSKDTIPYAGVHQFGWPEKNIVARPYLTFREEELELCQQRIADEMLAKLAGGG